MFNIEKGITMKLRKNGLTSTLRKLEIGDSFLCNKKYQRNAHSLSRKIGIKIATAKEGVDIIRVMRTD